jgi:hypothetical protein
MNLNEFVEALNRNHLTQIEFVYRGFMYQYLFNVMQWIRYAGHRERSASGYRDVRCRSFGSIDIAAGAGRCCHRRDQCSVIECRKTATIYLITDVECLEIT